MTIYLWKIPEDYPQKMIGRYERERSPDRFLFRQGIRLLNEEISSEAIIKFPVKRQQLEQYDCLVNSSRIPVVNQRLADLLLEFSGEDVQFFDAKIECADGELKGYKVLNVTHTVQGIDHERSRYRRIKLAPQFIANIQHLVLKPSCMMQHHLARDAEFEDNLLVTQTIKDAFKRNKITGVWLAAPEEFYGLVHARV